MSITQKQIAQSLGVSHQLVSYALSGGGTMSDQKRREILELAREMGYRRNELARAMATGKSHVIGLLTYGTSAEMIAAISSGVLEETVKKGYAVKVLNIPDNGSLSEICEIAHLCSAWQLDGAVGVALKPDAIAVFTEHLSDSRCPRAYIDIATKCDDNIVVKTDDRSAFRAAIEHLVALGHRRIVHLCGPDHPITQARNAIFLEILGEFELAVESNSLIRTHPTGWADRQSIEAATHALLDSPQRPSAVICAGDAAAMIVMRATQQHGLSVPKDLSVIGFGNFALGEHASPPLSSIAQPFREMGRLAVQRLIEQISSNGCDVSSATAHCLEELPAHLIVRESTARPAT